MERVRQVLQPQQQLCLNMLPLLLHINDPALPGFISETVPAGIQGYQPDDFVLKITRQHSRQFSGFVRPQREQPSIVALFLMGSSGSIAQSVRSDLDLWVCHSAGLSDGQISQLEEKFSALERWARTYNLELHLFPMNAESFRGGERETLNGEYCGSSQHYLLLDEFYRTGIHLAGGTPVWWYVPPGLESAYDSVVRQLFDSGVVSAEQVVDFGRIDSMPLGEFLGAAMWQLYKGIDAPWKSLLKLMLLECYLEDHAHGRGMLCHEFKQRVYDGELDLNRLDPYIMLYRRIERHLRHRKQPARLELVRQSLYQKLGITLSRPLSKGRTHWRREQLKAMVAEWEWSSRELSELDNRDTWGIERALKERYEIMREFTQSYRQMTRFARELGGKTFMKRQDMVVLGRKLHASFDRKPGKIEGLNGDVAPNLSQEKVTLHQLRNEEGGYRWAAYVDISSISPQHYPPPLKQSTSFIEVLLWCHLNGLLTGHLHIPVYSKRSHLTDFEIKEIMSTFRHLLPHPLPSAQQLAFRSPAQVRKAYLYVNVGVDPMISLSQRGLQKISSKVDSLDYSAMGENLVRTIDLVTVSSWNEVVCTRFAGRQALVECVQALFTQIGRGNHDALPEMEVFCFCPSRAAATAQRVDQLLRAMVNALFRPPGEHEPRYLLRVEQTYYLCRFIEGRLEAEPAESLRGLYVALGRPLSQFSPLVLDQNAMPQSSGLRLILQSAKPGQIVVCYQASKTHISYWVLDEVGALFFGRIENYGVSNLLNHLYRFLRNVEMQQMTEDPDDIEMDLIMLRRRIHFFVVRSATKERRARLVRWLGDEDDELDGGNLQVFVDRTSEGKVHYDIYLGDRSFSSLSLGNRLYRELAAAILSMRRGGEKYPVYISRLEFSDALLAGMRYGRAQTSQYLYYKQRLEVQINRHIV